MRIITTFPSQEAFCLSLRRVQALAVPYEVLRPEPAYAYVGAPAIVMDAETRMALPRDGDLECSGWVDYRPAGPGVPQEEPPRFAEDVFGRAAVMVLASCTGDVRKIRVIVHISGDLTAAFPYLNAVMSRAFFNPHGPTFTFMDGHRMVTTYSRRVAVAKADDLVDAWRVLEELRRRANQAWAQRDEIKPSYERREKPPALEIYKRLPGTNCGACGERTCLAFAVAVHGGDRGLRYCGPVFEGEFGHLRDALLQVCAGLEVEG